MAHIGAGDYKKQHVQQTNEFLKKYGGKIVKTVGRPIRLATPDLCEPFYHGKVVGVGESIGTVYPLLGEGIIPSMVCADLFVKNIGNNEQYRKDVLKYFSVYEDKNEGRIQCDETTWRVIQNIQVYEEE